MIKMTKGPAPTILSENWIKWTEVLRNRKANGEEPTEAEKSRYRNRDIKNALIQETHGKCVYCESKILHNQHGDIEHIVPKSKDVEQFFRWENLTLACRLCNGEKSDLEGVIDPYNEDPANELRFLGPFLMPLPNSEKGLYTSKVLDLNRMPLIEKRLEKIEYLRAAIDAFRQLKNEKQRKILLENFRIEQELGDKEFAAMARDFIKEYFCLF